MLSAIAHPYVQDVPGPQVAGLRQLLHESTRQPLGSVAVLQELCQETIGRSWDAGITPYCCAAIAVLWLALASERLQADTFSRAAGTVTTRPPGGPNTCPQCQKCQYCPLPCCRCDSTHVLHRCKQHVQLVALWLKPFPIRAVGLSSFLIRAVGLSSVAFTG